jgi:hypothetical protein
MYNAYLLWRYNIHPNFSNFVGYLGLIVSLCWVQFIITNTRTINHFQIPHFTLPAISGLASDTALASDNSSDQSTSMRRNGGRFIATRWFS